MSWTQVLRGYRHAAFAEKVAALATPTLPAPVGIPAGPQMAPRQVPVGPQMAPNGPPVAQARTAGPTRPQKPPALPPLLPHQKDAIDFVMRSGGSGLISHPTGAGKTRTAAEIGAMLRAKGGRTLYVTPASLKVNMTRGLRQWTPGVTTQMFKTGDEPIDPKVHTGVISYELFKKKAPELAAAGYDTAIFDEFHKAKDADTQTYKQVSGYRPLFKNYVGMTASLNSLSPTDMLQPINAITGGKHDLGSPTAFQRRYLRLRGDETNFMARKTMTPAQRREVIGFKHEHDLGGRLRKYVHYVGSEDLDPKLFPRKEVETIRVEMSPDQSKLYRYALRQLPPGATAALSSPHPSQTSVAKLYNHLIQTRALSGGMHTMLQGMSLADSARVTPKAHKALDDIENHLKEAPDGRVIIVTNLVQGGVDVVSEGLKQRGIPYGIFMGKGKGGTQEPERQQALSDFNAGKLKALVVSQAGHEGIDAPDTTMVVGYDGHFNPERILQAEARGVRAGGLKKREGIDRRVIVRRYVSVVPESKGFFASLKRMLGMQRREKSVDEKIYDIAQGRHQLNRQVFDLIAGRQPREHDL